MLADMVFPTHHSNIGSDQALAETEAVEVELILLPYIKHIPHRVEPLQGKAHLGPARGRLAMFGEGPAGIHVLKVAEWARPRVSACEEAPGIECLFVLIIP